MDLSDKYRPARFADLWQWPTSPTLKIVTNEIQRSNLQSPMLVRGNYGDGKTSLARIIGRRASCLNAHLHPYEPCGECEGCRNLRPYGATTWSEFGYFEIDCTEFSAAAVRDMVKEETAGRLFKNSCSHWVVCLDEIGRRDAAYQRQLLKLVENVRAHIILCCGTEDSVDKALKARCIVRPMRPPTQEQCLTAVRGIAEHERVTVCDSALPVLVSRLGCNPRDILKTLSNAVSLGNGKVGFEEIELALAMRAEQ